LLCCDAQAASAVGQSRLGGASCRSCHVRNAPLATVGAKKAARRDGPNNGHFAEWNLGDKSLAPYNREVFVLAFLVQRF